jgi:hypothetical protein
VAHCVFVSSRLCSSKVTQRTAQVTLLEGATLTCNLSKNKFLVVKGQKEVGVVRLVDVQTLTHSLTPSRARTHAQLIRTGAIPGFVARRV